MQRRTVLLITSDDVGWIDLRAGLQTLEGVDLVGEATTAREAIRLVSTLRPDVILAAARVEGVSARPLLLDLRRRIAPASKIVVFAARLEPDLFANLEDLPLAGYLLWSDLSVETLPHVVAVVVPSDVIVGSQEVARAFIATRCRPPTLPSDMERLTARERAVLRRLASGRSHKEIAKVEGMSPRTVDRVVAGLHEKLDTPTAFALGVKAAKFGLVP